MDSWWDLGEWSGVSGGELAIHHIICPFCLERGNFRVLYHADKKKPNDNKKLNFDTLECGNCKGYVMTLWSASSHGYGHNQMHDYRVLPWPMRIEKHPDHWPIEVGRFWIQAHRSITDENWDAAAVMARSALQAALRQQEAEGSNLKQEIENLASKGVLPPTMQAWSDTLRVLGNDSAHPKPDQAPPSPQDAKDIVQFLDFLLEYLYSLPHRIAQYRGRDRTPSR